MVSLPTERDRMKAIARIVVAGVLAVVLPVVYYLAGPGLPAMGTLPGPGSGGSSFPPSQIAFARDKVGPEPVRFPWITNVQIVDFDGDGHSDLLVCDAGENKVSVYRADRDGGWREEVLAENLAAPAHATVVDLDGDGDRDVVVSVLGNIYPDDGVIGRVVLLEKSDDGYHPYVLLDDVRRVADVQAGDLDGDGDIDLAVAVFGYNRGQVLWLENRGGRRFREHELHAAPGAIHVPVADYDGDGDLDIATVISQNEEEVWGFENLGNGEFRGHRLFLSFNFDLGSAGLVKSDLDGDGDVDLILPVGDNLEDFDAYPQPYHGCFWIENRGNWKFTARRIATFGGTYAADTGDLDGDGDVDVVLVSMANDWYDPAHASIVWLENDGAQNFQTRQIDSHPTHLVTVTCGDLNGDGRLDVAAGGLHLRGPYQRKRMGSVTLWINQGAVRK